MNRERVLRYRSRVESSREKTFSLSVKMDVLAQLLKESFDAEEDLQLYGIGLMIESFAKELEDTYRELDVVSAKLGRAAGLPAQEDCQK